MRVLLMVGCFREDLDEMPDRVTPVVAGAIDQTVWEDETQDETERRWSPMREAFDPDRGMNYEWREVWVDLPDDAMRMPFQTPAVAGVVVDDTVAASQGERE